METKELQKEKLNKRITELDLFRGIAVLLMIFDHIMYDLCGFISIFFPDFYGTPVYNLALEYWFWDVRICVRYFVIFIFLGLTGISCAFSKSNLKRGLKLMGVALFLTVVTFFIGLVMNDMDGMLIIFGVLHMIAFTIILISLIEMLTKNKWVYLVIGVLLVILGLIISNPVATPGGSFSKGFFKAFFEAFIGKALVGMDCFAFPFYGGQIFIGVFLGKHLYPERKPILFKNGYKNNFLTFVGRHALIVYVAHQVIVPVVLGIILLIFGFQISF